MTAWPDKDDLLTARILGHEAGWGAWACSCGFRPKSPSGVMPSVQTANHIWMVVHEAKEARAARFGEQLCQPCKGSGRDFLEEGAECRFCRGSGTLADLPRSEAESIARQAGHEWLGDGCVCGEGGTGWEGHASAVASSILAELDRFEEELQKDARSC